MPYLNDIHRIIKKSCVYPFLDNHEMKSGNLRRNLETPAQSKILNREHRLGEEYKPALTCGIPFALDSNASNIAN